MIWQKPKVLKISVIHYPTGCLNVEYKSQGNFPLHFFGKNVHDMPSRTVIPL